MPNNPNNANTGAAGSLGPLSAGLSVGLVSVGPVLVVAGVVTGSAAPAYLGLVALGYGLGAIVRAHDPSSSQLRRIALTTGTAALAAVAGIVTQLVAGSEDAFGIVVGFCSAAILVVLSIVYRTAAGRPTPE